MKPITDPALLEQLDAPDSKLPAFDRPQRKAVTDKALIDQLEGKQPKEVDSIGSRIMSGLADPIYGAAQIADRVLVNPIRQAISPGATSMEDVIASRNANYKAPEGVDVARMAGNVLNPISWAGGGAGVARAAAGGALQAALNPVSNDRFWEEKAIQTGAGAGGGALLSKLLRGVTPSADAQKLMNQGIQPTVGQAKGGMLNKMEERASSVPFLGGVVDWARRRPLDEFQGSVLKRAVGKSVKNIDEANTAVSDAYNAVVPSMKPTAESVANVQAAVRNAADNPELTPDRLAMLQGMVNKNFKSFGQLEGEGIKKLDSELGYLGRKYTRSQSPADQTLGDEVYNVLGGLREGLESGLPEHLQGAHQQANSAFKNMVPINKAASQRADERVMPRALQRALARQQGMDVSRSAADELVDPAVKVLPNTVPDSGTAGRLLQNSTASLLGLPLAAVAAPFATRTGQAALLGNTRAQRAISPYDAKISDALISALRGADY